MKITIEGTAKEDFPSQQCSNPQFVEAMKMAVRRRLELRPQDTVEIIIRS